MTKVTPQDALCEKALAVCIYDALRNLVPFTQFKKRNIPPWVFFTFFKL